MLVGDEIISSSKNYKNTLSNLKQLDLQTKNFNPYGIRTEKSPDTLTALEKRKKYEEESNYREFALGSPGLFRKSVDTKVLLSNKTDKYLQGQDG